MMTNAPLSSFLGKANLSSGSSLFALALWTSSTQTRTNKVQYWLTNPTHRQAPGILSHQLASKPAQPESHTIESIQSIQSRNVKNTLT